MRYSDTPIPDSSLDKSDAQRGQDELRNAILRVLYRHGNMSVDSATIEDILKTVAHHTQEAVERSALKARIDENRLARNAMEPNEAKGVPYVPAFDLYTSDRNRELEEQLTAHQPKEKQ